MSDFSAQVLYDLPCCGRRSVTPPNGFPCYDCAKAATPLNDPIAVAYRRRCAARSPSPTSDPTVCRCGERMMKAAGVWTCPMAACKNRERREREASRV